MSHFSPLQRLPSRAESHHHLLDESLLTGLSPTPARGQYILIAAGGVKILPELRQRPLPQDSAVRSYFTQSNCRGSSQEPTRPRDGPVLVAAPLAFSAQPRWPPSCSLVSAHLALRLWTSCVPTAQPAVPLLHACRVGRLPRAHHSELFTSVRSYLSTNSPKGQLRIDHVMPCLCYF